MKCKKRWHFVLTMACFFMVIMNSRVLAREEGYDFEVSYEKYAENDSQIFVNRGSQSTIFFYGEELDENNIQVKILQRLGEEEIDVTEQYFENFSWKQMEESCYSLSFLWREEGHFQVILNESYYGPEIVVDETFPVIESILSQEEPVKQEEGYDCFDTYPRYEITIVEENFDMDCFSLQKGWDSVRISSYEKEYENGVVRHRIGFVPEKEGKYDLFFQVGDLTGTHKTQGECHFLVDRSAPQIGISVNHEKEVLSHETDQLTYFSKKPISLILSAKDKESGIDGIYYSYWTRDGEIYEKYEKNPDFTTEFSVKITLDQKDFMGWVTVKATNKMGVDSQTENSPALLWESEESHILSSWAEILLPEADFIDEDRGLKFYKENPMILLRAGDSISAICESYIKTTYKKQSDKMEVDYTDQKKYLYEVQQEEEVSIAGMDQSSGENPITVKGGFWDYAGHKTQCKDPEYAIVVDKIPPQITVSYETSQENGFYKEERTALVTVEDWNFHASQTKWKIGGRKDGYSIGQWQGSGNKHWCKVRFYKDGTYTMGLSVADYAGNVTSCKEQESFTMDMTKPEIKLWMNRSDLKEGRFYAEEKMVYIFMKDEYAAKENLMVYNGSHQETIYEIQNDKELPQNMVSYLKKDGWKIYRMSCKKEGTYHISCLCQDQAGNQSDLLKYDVFTIDKTSPQATMIGLREEMTFSGDFSPTIQIQDPYLSMKDCKIQIFYEDGSEASFLEEKMTREEEGKTLTFSFKNVEKEIKNDNHYIMKITAKDYAGNMLVDHSEISFYLNRGGARFILDQDTQNYLKKYYQKEEKDILLWVYSLQPLHTEISISKDHQSSWILTQGQYEEVTRRAGYSEEKREIPDQILPINLDGWYLTSYRIPEKLFEEEGSYQLVFHSKERCRGETVDFYKESDNVLWTDSIEFAIDKTPPNVVIGGLEEKIYTSSCQPYTITAMDNTRLKRVRVHVRINGKDQVKDYRETDFNELESITEELFASSGYQYVGYEAWDYAGNFTSTIHSEEEKKILISQSSLVIAYGKHPVASIFVLLFIICGLLFLTRY